MGKSGNKKNIFERVEKKYLLTEEKYELLIDELEEHAVMDDYGESTICNIYFDTEDFRIIRASIEKPIYKEKLRLRSYGVPSGNDKVFVELKKKFKKVVFKRRESMQLCLAEKYLYEGKKFFQETQITKEIDWFFNFYSGLKPQMYISYDRIALYGIKDSQLRITFDRNLLWRTEELSLSNGVWGNYLLPQGDRVMEIKINGVMPLWLSEILNRLEIFPCSFSKYGNAYLQMITKTTNKKGAIICA